MGTTTSTRTYTVVDIRRVVDCFAADYDMIAQSTGLVTQQHVTEVVQDLKLLAESSYLTRIHIILQGEGRESLRAAVYNVIGDGSLSSTQRPGGNFWPRTPGGSVRIVIEYAAAWKVLTDASKDAVRQKLTLPWSPSELDITYPSLTHSAGRTYASSGYAWTKSDYQ